MNSNVVVLHNGGTCPNCGKMPTPGLQHDCPSGRSGKALISLEGARSAMEDFMGGVNPRHAASSRR